MSGCFVRVRSACWDLSTAVLYAQEMPIARYCREQVIVNHWP